MDGFLHDGSLKMMQMDLESGVGTCYELRTLYYLTLLRGHRGFDLGDQAGRRQRYPGSDKHRLCLKVKPRMLALRIPAAYLPR